MSQHLLPRAVALIALFLSLHCEALTCGELQAQIEAKISARGVAQFNVKVIGADEPFVGQVVGTCDRGAKKLIYTQGATNATPPTTFPTKDAKKTESVITECKDGSASSTGECKK